MSPVLKADFSCQRLSEPTVSAPGATKPKCDPIYSACTCSKACKVCWAWRQVGAYWAHSGNQILCLSLLYTLPPLSPPSNPGKRVSSRLCQRWRTEVILDKWPGWINIAKLFLVQRDIRYHPDQWLPKRCPWTRGISSTGSLLKGTLQDPTRNWGWAQLHALTSPAGDCGVHSSTRTTVLAQPSGLRTQLRTQRFKEIKQLVRDNRIETEAQDSHFQKLNFSNLGSSECPFHEEWRLIKSTALQSTELCYFQPAQEWGDPSFQALVSFPQDPAERSALRHGTFAASPLPGTEKA